MIFEDSDGWILCAITLAGQPASLTKVLWTADHLNAALPTLAELNGALDRLGKSGLVRRTNDMLSVANAISEFHARWMHEPARMLIPRFDDFLRSWQGGEGSILQPFTAAELAAAQAQYSVEHAAVFRKLKSGKGKGRQGAG
jgi:hypothetical protein